MKKFTSIEQTGKLIELGFEKPKTCLGVGTKEEAGDLELAYIWAYSIGELIEMLPAKIDGTYCNIDRCGQRSWAISYDPMIYCCNCAELVDALYDMLIDLRENDLIHLKSNESTKDK